MIGIVNRLIEKYGEIDETRIELARELQRSKKEREDMDKQNRENLKRNEEIAEKLKKENGINKPTHRMLMKYRQFEETGGKCMYCGGDIDLKTFMYGIDTEWEHIIPKALLFDNSFSNSICACQKCNKTKNDRTAYDYMRSLGTQRFNDYKGRVKKMYDEKSIAVEINGLSSKSLLTIAEMIAKEFRQETVLVKDLNKNKIYTADSIPMPNDTTLDDELGKVNTNC